MKWGRGGNEVGHRGNEVGYGGMKWGIGGYFISRGCVQKKG